jgi:Family of unknown function (DUF6166)
MPGTAKSTAFKGSQSPQVDRYRGAADRSGRHVWVERNGVRRPLPRCGEDDIVPYSGGRAGPGARELARAVLLDATGSIALAERFCRDLTHEVVAHLPEPEFTLERDNILTWLAHPH